MAWQCSGSTNDELVANLARARIIESRSVYDAMMRVDRACFVPADMPRDFAYQDSPQSIGYGATISAPHMHAMCLELLAHHLRPGKRALDVGSGSGYLVAAMASMIAPKETTTSEEKTAEHAAAESKQEKYQEKHAEKRATASIVSGATASTSSSTVSSSSSLSSPVIGIEHMRELVTLSHSNLDRWNSKWRDVITVVQGDGRLGIQGAQFDAIHVGAAAAQLPKPLLDQLAPGGRMIIPVGTHDQHLMCIDKDAHGHLSQRTVTGVRYVPLTDAEKQRDSTRYE